MGKSWSNFVKIKSDVIILLNELRSSKLIELKYLNDKSKLPLIITKQTITSLIPPGH